MPITNTQEKLIHSLGDVYDAEHQFLEAQQEFLPQASNPQLKRMIEEHIAQSQAQVQALEQVFSQLEQQPRRVMCHGAQGLVSEGRQNVEEAATPELRDLAIADAQAKVEHYEIASYTGLVTAAQEMGRQEAVQLLQQNLKQEQQTAQRIEQATPQLIQTAMQAEGTQAAAS